MDEGRCLHTDPKWATSPGYFTEATHRADIVSQVARASTTSARAKQRATEMEEIIDKRYIIIGSPDEVVEQMTEVATELNVGHLMLLLQFGNIGKNLAKYNTKRFAEKGLPKLQPFFSEWEDPWWPKPIDNTERAEVSPFIPSLAAE